MATPTMSTKSETEVTPALVMDEAGNLRDDLDLLHFAIRYAYEQNADLFPLVRAVATALDRTCTLIDHLTKLHDKRTEGAA
jgi:hypothetical protein